MTQGSKAGDDSLVGGVGEMKIGRLASNRLVRTIQGFIVTMSPAVWVSV